MNETDCDPGSDLGGDEMDTYLILARIVYALDVMVWLLPKLAIATAAGLAAWGVWEARNR